MDRFDVFTSVRVESGHLWLLVGACQKCAEVGSRRAVRNDRRVDAAGDVAMAADERAMYIG